MRGAVSCEGDGGLLGGKEGWGRGVQWGGGGLVR